MISILVGYDRAVARWVGERVGIEDFGQYTALGIARDGDLVAGVIYNNYREVNIEATMASVTPRWCTRGILRAMFWYPFEQLGVARITLVIARSNECARKFVRHLGFQQEGVMRHGFRSGEDAVIYGMLRAECRWLGENV